MKKTILDPEFQLVGDPILKNAYWLFRVVGGRIQERKFIPQGFDIYLSKDAPAMGLKKGFQIGLPIPGPRA